MTASAVRSSPSTLKCASFSSRMWRTTERGRVPLDPVGVAQHEEDADAEPDDEDHQPQQEPSLMDTPANPDAMPVANGLIVEPKVPIPQPSRTTAAPVSAS